jgi:hypothetical protein
MYTTNIKRNFRFRQFTCNLISLQLGTNLQGGKKSKRILNQVVMYVAMRAGNLANIFTELAVVVPDPRLKRPHLHVMCQLRHTLLQQQWFVL